MRKISTRKSANSSKKSGLALLNDASSPSFGTEKHWNSEQIRTFFPETPNSGSGMAERHPYKKARLVHFDYDLSKRWYVIFYAWNVATERVERKRIFNPINRKKTVRARIDIAEDIISQVNADLVAGKVLGKDQLKKISTGAGSEVDKLTLQGSLKYFAQEKAKAKRRHNYLKRFTGNLSTHLQDYLTDEDIEDPLIKHVVKDDSDFMENFFEWLSNRLGSNKTFNNYRSDFTVLFNFLNKKKNKKLFTTNPMERIESRRVVKKKHAAFNDRQVAVIIDTATKMGFLQLVFFLRFIYYSLARPSEVLALRIRDIDLEHDRIIIHGGEAKNWRDEYVNISPGFKSIIIESGIMDYAPTFYVFGRDGIPSEVPHRSDFVLYKRFVKVVTQLKLREQNPNYSPYSFKHSGAISLYLATKDIYAVKEQCRHTTIQQTDDYLRDLGVMRKESPVMNWKGAA